MKATTYGICVRCGKCSSYECESSEPRDKDQAKVEKGVEFLTLRQRMAQGRCDRITIEAISSRTE